MAAVDILIPTCRRPAALAVTLAGLIAQDFRDFRLVVSDQTEDEDPFVRGEVRTAVGVLRMRGHDVELHRHLPRCGLAEQRQFLLGRARAPQVLFLDDDLVLENDVVGRMHRVLLQEGCGFVGSAPIGPSYIDDIRPHQQHIEWWDGPVQPEAVRPGTPQWQRHHLHSAANLYHVQQRLRLTPATQRVYRVAWIGACVMYDAAKLRACGGFDFWRQLPPEHCGEDVLAQLRVMDRFGGCGLIPSGVYHQELPTTVVDRRVNAPHVLPVELPA
jgi:GT2 family glycosyltransferase